MGSRSWGKPDFRDLTVEELSNLIFLSYTDFLQNLLIDGDGNILNHDEAEERGAEYIRHNC